MGKYLESSPVSPWERLFKAPLSPGGKWVSARSFASKIARSVQKWNKQPTLPDLPTPLTPTEWQLLASKRFSFSRPERSCRVLYGEILRPV